MDSTYFCGYCHKNYAKKNVRAVKIYIIVMLTVRKIIGGYIV